MGLGSEGDGDSGLRHGDVGVGDASVPETMTRQGTDGDLQGNRAKEEITW